MNVAFFLTPKSDVIWLAESAPVRVALECMERHRFTAIPVLEEHGRYVGTLTEGDLLFKLWRTPNLSVEATEALRVADVPRRVVNLPVNIDAEIEELLFRAIEQNFVPVIDSRSVFIGIVRRRPIIEHCAKLLRDLPTSVTQSPNGRKGMT